MKVQEYKNLVPTLGTVQGSRSPPTYRVRRGEGSIQGGEGRITTLPFVPLKEGEGFVDV